jgi:hypothetical protein
MDVVMDFYVSVWMVKVCRNKTRLVAFQLITVTTGNNQEVEENIQGEMIKVTCK